MTGQMLRSNVNIVHLTYRDGHLAVYPSQVVAPMSLLREKGHNVELILCKPLGQYLRRRGRRLWNSRQQLIRNKFGRSFFCIPSPPARVKALWDEAGMVRNRLYRTLKHFDNVVVHCRGPFATNVALRAVKDDTRFRVIYDCRGLAGAEAQYKGGDGNSHFHERTRRIEVQEIKAAKECDKMTCVSDAMKTYVTKTWNVSQNKVFVVPCYADVEVGARALEHRDSVRDELGVTNRFVVVYCGSSADWNIPEESISTVKELIQLEPSTYFLAITPSPERFRTSMEYAGLNPNRYSILSLEHSEVPRYLVAGDLGLLIRKPNIVNNVASPVKFAEYLSCGVPVAITHDVGDYSNMVRQYQVGVTYRYADSRQRTQELRGFLNEYKQWGSSIRGKCQNLASEKFSYTKNIGKLLELYEQALKKPMRRS